MTTPSLSPREETILQWTLSGASSRQIAGALGIAPKTVENHRARILQKFNVRNTAALVNTLYERRLTTLEHEVSRLQVAVARLEARDREVT